MRISDWSSDVCSSDLHHRAVDAGDVQQALHPQQVVAAIGHQHVEPGGQHVPFEWLVKGQAERLDRAVVPVDVDATVFGGEMLVTMIVAVDRKSTRLNSSH